MAEIWLSCACKRLHAYQAGKGVNDAILFILDKVYKHLEKPAFMKWCDDNLLDLNVLEIKENTLALCLIHSSDSKKTLSWLSNGVNKEFT